MLLIPEIRRTKRAPDYSVICRLTGCSHKNSHRRAQLWAMADSFARSDSPESDSESGQCGATSWPSGQKRPFTDEGDAATLKRLTKMICGGNEDESLVEQGMLLVPVVRKTKCAPNYDVICAISHCSAKNRPRKAQLWALMDEFAREAAAGA